MTTFGENLQSQIVDWHDREWRNLNGSLKSAEQVLNKLAEEVGELTGAITKYREGRTDKDWMAEARAEFGDVMIVMTVLAERITYEACGRRNIPKLEDYWAERFDSVKERRSDDYRDSESQVDLLGNYLTVVVKGGDVWSRSNVFDLWRNWSGGVNACTSMHLVTTRGPVRPFIFGDEISAPAK